LLGIKAAKHIPARAAAARFLRIVGRLGGGCLICKSRDIYSVIPNFAPAGLIPGGEDPDEADHGGGDPRPSAEASARWSPILSGRIAEKATPSGRNPSVSTIVQGTTTSKSVADISDAVKLRTFLIRSDNAVFRLARLPLSH
jgi:hypothetical protein